jgi:hypothetical protein
MSFTGLLCCGWSQCSREQEVRRNVEAAEFRGISGDAVRSQLGLMTKLELYTRNTCTVEPENLGIGMNFLH